MDERPPGAPPKAAYTREELYSFAQKYSAASSARHLLPLLGPGLRLLDFGCGLGTISTGLADAIAPGELHGVDVDGWQIEIARFVARERGCQNAHFQVGDVTDLPFEDDFFDVAHGHNVLMHVPDTAAALAELKRVLKPGGVLACREMIVGSCFGHPDFGVTASSWEMFADMIGSEDGHPQMGKDMKEHIVAAGFENLRVTASFDTYSAPADVAFAYAFALKWFLSRDFTDAAIKYGATTEELAAKVRTAHDKWKDHHGAIAAVAHGEAISNKPAA